MGANGHLDTVGMWDAAFAFPEQCARAADAGRDLDGLPEKDRIEHVVVLGMGGSGVAGDILTAAAGPYMAVPVVVSKTYGLPAFVGEQSLVFAVSFSGNTEETLEATEIAHNEGARIVAVTRGGELGAKASAWGAPVVGVPDDIPAPRAALGALSIPLMVVLEEIGLFPGASNWISHAVKQLEKRREALRGDGGIAAAVAKGIGRTVPLIYGGGGLGQVAAQRWKAQINENVKVPAFFNTQPELCHNEIVGWGQHGDMTRQVFTVVDLRHGFEHPQISRRFELVDDIIEEVVAGVEEVEAEGEGQLAQLLDLVMIGDFVSLHMAAREGLDPGPVPVIDELKKRLAGD